MGWNDTLFLVKTFKINIEIFTSQHHRKIKIAKRQSAISLQKARDLYLDSGDSDLDSCIKVSSGEED